MSRNLFHYNLKLLHIFLVAQQKHINHEEPKNIFKCIQKNRNSALQKYVTLIRETYRTTHRCVSRGHKRNIISNN